MGKKVYIANIDSWFKEGSECEQLEDYGISGLYRGIYIVGPNIGYDTFWHKKGYDEGDEVEMNEVCDHGEFLVLDKLMKFKVGDDVIIHDHYKMASGIDMKGNEGVIKYSNIRMNYYIVDVDNTEVMCRFDGVVINREKRLAKLLDKKK